MRSRGVRAAHQLAQRLALVAAVGCRDEAGPGSFVGSGSAVAPAGSASAEEQLVRASEALGRAVTATNGDCARAAAAIRDETSRIKIARRQFLKARPHDEPHAAAKKRDHEFDATYGKRVKDAWEPVMALAGPCSKTPDFEAAVRALREASTLAACGDGVVDASEDCDDGNAIDFDGCTRCTTYYERGSGSAR